MPYIAYVDCHRLITAPVTLTDHRLISANTIALITLFPSCYYRNTVSIAYSVCYHLILADYHFMLAIIMLFTYPYHW